MSHCEFFMSVFLEYIIFFAVFGIALFLFAQLIGFVISLYNKILDFFYYTGEDDSTQLDSSPAVARYPVFTYVNNNDEDFWRLFPACLSLSAMSSYWSMSHDLPLITGIALCDSILLDIDMGIEDLNNNIFDDGSNFDTNNHSSDSSFGRGGSFDDF